MIWWLMCLSRPVCISTLNIKTMFDYWRVLPAIFLLLCLGSVTGRLLRHLEIEDSKELYFENEFIQIQ